MTDCDCEYCQELFLELFQDPLHTGYCQYPHFSPPSKKMVGNAESLMVRLAFLLPVQPPPLLPPPRLTTVSLHPPPAAPP